MDKGTLTPRTNKEVAAMRFSGNFGQPDGFGSVLLASIRESGDLCLTLDFLLNGKEMMWSVMLTNDQRTALAGFLNRYHPRLYEVCDGATPTVPVAPEAK
jgi:hypothetical protein